MAVQLSDQAAREVRDALLATSRALGHYAAACRRLRSEPEAAPLATQLDRSIARLEAMQRDMIERGRHSKTPDALFVGLNVAQAGLSSLADAVGEVRQACWALFPHPEPEQGWFVDAQDDPEQASRR